MANGFEERRMTMSVIVNSPSSVLSNTVTSLNYRLRRLVDRVVKVLCLLCVIAVLYPLFSMLYMFVYRGARLISIQTITTLTVSGSSLVSGGLSNAITGTILLLGIGSAIAVSLGVLGGVYLAEFSHDSGLAKAVSFCVDVLAGIPSIVLGYVGFLVLVVYLGWGYSALAGGFTLSVFMLPYVMRTTELALKKVPDDVREAAKALGSTRTTMVNKLVLRLALPGIITGVLLAVSIGMGETAPLLYTASFSNYIPSALLHSPVGYLTYVVYVFSQLPTNSAHDLAYEASFMLIVIIALINLVARVWIPKYYKLR